MDSDSDSPTYEFVLPNANDPYPPNASVFGPTFPPRTSSVLNDKPTFKRMSDLYFPDGNVILEAGTTHFRVSRGILAARSPVFKEVLSLPQPKDGGQGSEEKVDGCDVVHLFGDDPQEVTYFLRAIYDSRCVSFHQSPLKYTDPQPATHSVSLNRHQRLLTSPPSPVFYDSARNTMWTTSGGGH